MATVKNEVFIGLLHENFYLVGKEYIYIYTYIHMSSKISSSV